MILIVTLNPLLERRFYFDTINLREVNRNSATKISAGGKGINISRQLKKFNVKSFNYFISGGINGKIFRESLKAENLDFSFLSIKSETRHAAVVISKNDKSVTSFFSENPHIQQEEVNKFKNKLEKMIQNCEIVIFSGSSPCRETDSIIPYGIELANKYDKVSLCDTYGKHLRDCIDASPTMIHNNFAELSNTFSVSLDSEKSVVDFLSFLYKKNIKRAFLTNGSNNFYASNFNYFYKVKPLKVQEIDPTGSGDSFVAAIINSWINSDVFENSLRFATTIAGLNATSFDTSSVKLEDSINLLDKIEVVPIGKKAKTIDVSPREI